MPLSSSRYIRLVSDVMPTQSPTSAGNQRAAWMRVLSLSAWTDLESCAGDVAATPHDVLRAPETGLVMLRGRMGATGGAFNLGEATVTRCAVRLGLNVGSKTLRAVVDTMRLLHTRAGRRHKARRQRS